MFLTIVDRWTECSQDLAVQALFGGHYTLPRFICTWQPWTKDQPAGEAKSYLTRAVFLAPTYTVMRLVPPLRLVRADSPNSLSHCALSLHTQGKSQLLLRKV